MVKLTHTHSHFQCLFKRSKPETTRIALKMHFSVRASWLHVKVKRSIIRTVLPFLHSSIMFVSGIVNCIVVALFYVCFYVFCLSSLLWLVLFLILGYPSFCFVKICNDSVLNAIYAAFQYTEFMYFVVVFLGFSLSLFSSLYLFHSFCLPHMHSQM